MQKLIRSLHLVDYLVGAGTVAYGIYDHSWLIGSLGLSGLVLARMNLADKLSKRLEGYLRRKQTVSVVAPLEESAVQVAPPTTMNDYGMTRLNNGELSVGSSRHSVLKAAQHLNHAQHD